MGKVGLRLWRGPKGSCLQQPHSSPEGGTLPALGWCLLSASTVPSVPGNGWTLMQEERLQKIVSALESSAPRQGQASPTQKQPLVQRSGLCCLVFGWFPEQGRSPDQSRARKA